MSKTKILSYVGGLVMVLGLGVGGFIWQQRTAESVTSERSRSVSNQATAAASAPVSQNIPLNQAKPAPDPNSLQVKSNSSFNSTNQAAGSQQTLGQVTTGSGTTPAATDSPFDPSKFAEYDKYKTEQSALFGDVQVGTGATLEPTKKAVVFYRGWLTNGTKFDESRLGSDGKLTPFIFTLGAGQVIPGWEQALAGMKVGGVRLVIVPPAAGYGAKGTSGIPPNSVLVFQVQLSDVQ